MPNLVQVAIDDLKSAISILIRHRGFSAAAVATIALGIGAVCAVFSVVYGVIVRPLPFPESEELVSITMEQPERGIYEGLVSIPDYVDWRDESRSLEAVALFSKASYVFADKGLPERLSGAQATASYFRALGIPPLLGTLNSERWDISGSRLVAFGESFWRSRFGGDPEILGRGIRLDGEIWTVAAVLPDQVAISHGIHLWTPVDLQAGAAFRAGRYLQAIGRLAPGISVTEANAEMSRLSVGLASAHPKTNQGFAAKLTPLHDDLVGDVRSGLVALMLAVCCVLLIVLANIAGMILARGAARREEVWTRSALGASRLMLVRQLLAENLLMAMTGGVLGLLLGRFGSGLLLRLYPQELPVTAAVQVGPEVVALGVALALGAGLLFGFLPAMQLARTRSGGGLSRGEVGRSLSRATRRAQASVLVLQVAVTLALLVASAVTVASLLRLFAVDPGFQAEGLLTGRVALPAADYPEPTQKVAFFEALRGRLESVPGVEAVSAATHIPLARGNMLFGVSVVGVEKAAGEAARVNYRSVAPGYFETLGVPVLEGRGVVADDRAESRRVVVVNESFVRQILGDETALGRKIKLTFGDAAPLEIVGVVRDLRHFGIGAEARPAAFVPFAQSPWPFMTMVLRTSLEPRSLEGALRSEVAAMASGQPVDRIATMQELLDGSVAQPRFYGQVMFLFALFAMLAAALGIYGLSSYWVRSSLSELGVRMALGASPGAARRLFLSRLAILGALGISLGVALSWGTRGVLEDWLQGSSLETYPLLVLAAAVLAALVMSFGAWPAWRAGSIDPATVLRQE